MSYAYSEPMPGARQTACWGVAVLPQKAQYSVPHHRGGRAFIPVSKPKAADQWGPLEELSPPRHGAPCHLATPDLTSKPLGYFRFTGKTESEDLAASQPH